jgi:hypothetical protein
LTATAGRETQGVTADSKHEPTPQLRQYFQVTDDGTAVYRAPEFEWVNETELADPGYTGLAPGPHEQGAGFPPFVAPPRIVFSKKGKRPPLDFNLFGRIWLISDRFKRLLEAFDPEAFEFVRTDTAYDGGTREGPPFWFCDVIRVLDCLDEDRSTILYQENITWKVYASLASAVVRPEAVGAAHVFRLRHYRGRVLVDDVFRGMVHANKITGFNFKTLDGSGKRVR